MLREFRVTSSELLQKIGLLVMQADFLETQLAQQEDLVKNLMDRPPVTAETVEPTRPSEPEPPQS